MLHLECAENGNLDDFMWAVEAMPGIKWVSNHCGGLTGSEMQKLASNLAGAPNLWVDTTFRSADDMREMVKLFGEDKVIFGIDRPYGRLDCSLNAAWEAFGKYTILSEKTMYRNAAKLMKMIPEV